MGRGARGDQEHLPQLGLPHPPADLRRRSLRSRRLSAHEVWSRHARRPSRARLAPASAGDLGRAARPARPPASAGARRAAGPDPPARASCCRSTSTTRTARGCSTPSPGCPSTTRPAASGRSSPPALRRSPPAPARTRWSSWAAARRTRRACSSRALSAAGTLRRFVPFDVDAVTLRGSTLRIAAEFPSLAVHAVVGDFERHVPLLPQGGRRLIAFLGGTIGNLAPPAAGPLPRGHRRAARARPTRSCSERIW